MKIYQEVTCTKTQKAWLMCHLRQLLYIYDELIKTLHKRYVQCIHEKGYLRASHEDKGRYLICRRICKGRCFGYDPTTAGMVSSPFQKRDLLIRGSSLNDLEAFPCPYMHAHKTKALF